MNVVVSAIVDPWVTTLSFVVALAMRIQETIGAFTFEDVLQWIIKYRHVETVSGLQKVLHSDYFCDIQTNVIRFNLARAGLYKYEWGNLLASTHERQLNFETGLI